MGTSLILALDSFCYTRTSTYRFASEVLIIKSMFQARNVDQGLLQLKYCFVDDIQTARSG